MRPLKSGAPGGAPQWESLLFNLLPGRLIHRILICYGNCFFPFVFVPCLLLIINHCVLHSSSCEAVKTTQ